MLHSHAPLAKPSIAYTTPDHEPEGHWSQLSVAERIARVVRRLQQQRGGEDAPVTDRDFRREPETCDLTRAEIEDAQAKVTAILAQPVDPLDAYDRRGRVTRAVSLIAGQAMSAQDWFTILRTEGYLAVEIGNLWPDICAGYAEQVRNAQRPDLVS